MRYKAGDRARVRSWESMKNEFGRNKNGNIPAGEEIFVDCMKKYCGKIVKVKEIRGTYYKIEDTETWNFTDDMLEPVEFDWESFKNPKNKIAVHCKTEEEAKDFCRQMHEHGMKWSTGSSYLDYNWWKDYREDTCYANEGHFSPIRFYKEKNYTILEWSDYMNTEKKEFTLSDLKDEMIVELRNGNRYVVLGVNFIRERGFNRKANYNKCFKNKEFKELDIIAIYPPSKNYNCGFKSMLTPNAEPIWTEKKTVKMIVEEMKKKLSEIIGAEIVEG